MSDIDRLSERVEIMIWINRYISPLGNETPWIEGHVMINKAILTFAVKFLCLLVRFKLRPTTLDDVLMWDEDYLIASMVSGYDIDFVDIIWCEIPDIALSVITTLSFPCLIQRLCNEACMPEIPGFNKRV